MTTLPKLSRAQANALRLADRKGGLRWDGVCWVGGDIDVGLQIIRNATLDALDRYGCINLTRSSTIHPSEFGRAWLAANPDCQA